MAAHAAVAVQGTSITHRRVDAIAARIRRKTSTSNDCRLAAAKGLACSVTDLPR